MVVFEFSKIFSEQYSLYEIHIKSSTATCVGRLLFLKKTFSDQNKQYEVRLIQIYSLGGLWGMEYNPCQEDHASTPNGISMQIFMRRHRLAHTLILQVLISQHICECTVHVHENVHVSLFNVFNAGAKKLLSCVQPVLSCL